MGMLDRIARTLGYERAPVPGPGAVRWSWPMGNGDRGPPGSWQRNFPHPSQQLELLAFSAVYACINTIATDLAKLPPQVYEVDMATGARTLRRQDYYAGLFREPNPYQTTTDFVHGFMQSVLTQGNTYCWIGKRNGRGEVAEMHTLNPYRVQPIIATDGSIFYRCGEDYLAGVPNGAVIPARDMIHHRLPLLPGYPLVGVTPVFAAAASSAVGLRILQNSQQFFANASRPSGTLNAPGKVSEPLARRLAEEWDENYRGERYGKTAVLSEGLTWQPLTITPQDAQLIEQIRWSVEDVARVFRVPPFMLGDMTKISYRNVETLGRVYLTECLGWYIEAAEERFEAAFQFTPNFEIKFDTSALLRTEIDVRFAAYTQALSAGWHSINEVRSLEGLPPVEGGEEPRVQMQYVPLSQATGPATPAQPGPADSAGDPGGTANEPNPEAAFEASKRRVRARMQRRMREAAPCP